MAAISRRTHKKSKKGCVDCKQRHIKCDEGHPVCGNCKISQRDCRYKDMLVPQSTESLCLENRSKRSLQKESESYSSTSSSTSSEFGEYSGYGEVNMQHLELFRHFAEKHPTFFGYNNGTFGISSSEMTGMILAAPYTVYQSLALAALHLSVTLPARRRTLRKHATDLQRHALAKFERMDPKLDAGDCVSVFLFKSIHAFHVLSEKLTNCSKSFDGLLEDITDVMRLHQEVHAVTRRSWDSLLQSALNPILQREPKTLHHGLPGAECEELLARVHSASIDLSTKKVYTEAIQSLQAAFNGSRSNGSGSSAIGPIISWLVVAPPCFMNLISEKRPEALVILSYFGALLHMHREIWAFGNGGGYIVESVTCFLNDSWSAWLHWPNQICRDCVAKIYT